MHEINITIKKKNKRLLNIMLLIKKSEETMHKISIETYQRKKIIKIEISKRKIPHEYWPKWNIKAISKELLCFKKNKKQFVFTV